MKSFLGWVEISDGTDVEKSEEEGMSEGVSEGGRTRRENKEGERRKRREEEVREEGGQGGRRRRRSGSERRITQGESRNEIKNRRGKHACVWAVAIAPQDDVSTWSGLAFLEMGRMARW
jgi:hypothetical protein